MTTKEEIAAYHAERLIHYTAKLGDCELARINAEWDTRMRFRNEERGRAVAAMFAAAHAGIIGGFVIRHEDPV